MLPVTHGVRYTKLHVLLYTILLGVASILPVVVGMSHWIYLVGAVVLWARFLFWAIVLMRSEDPKVAMRTFRFSIVYLMALFVFLLVDHYMYVMKL